MDLNALERSFDLVAPHGDELIELFYARLFETAPGGAARCSRTPTWPASARCCSPRSCCCAGACATSTRSSPRCATLGARHVAYGAEPAHYAVVGTTLIGAMAEIAGADWTPRYTEAWTEAFGVVALHDARGRRRGSGSSLPPERAKGRHRGRPFSAPPTTTGYQPSPKPGTSCCCSCSCSWAEVARCGRALAELDRERLLLPAAGDLHLDGVAGLVLVDERGQRAAVVDATCRRATVMTSPTCRPLLAAGPPSVIARDLRARAVRVLVCTPR